MKTKKDKISIINMGCSKNLIDSENIYTHLQKNGYEVSFEKGDKDTNTVIINTCGFIHDAKTESIDKILQFVDLKNKGKLEKLFVTGCLSQRYKEDLQNEIPEVDGFFGTEIKDIIDDFDIPYKNELLNERNPTTPPHYAYLKIAEGCRELVLFVLFPDLEANILPEK
ncbi:MAG: hypothetical protein R2771_09885 [Saprospiraceae bacterium]